METKANELTESIEWFLDHLASERGASRNTVAAYRNDLLKAADFFLGRDLPNWQEIRSRDIMDFASTLGPPLAPATAQRRISALRSFLKFLKRQGEGPPGDLPQAVGFRKARLLPKALSLEQIQALLAAPDLAAASGLRDRALMELIYGAGLRVSEAVGLPVQDLDLENRVLRVTGKREKTRVVPLPSQSCAWLGRYLESARPKLAIKPLPNLLVSDRGKPMLRQTAFARLASLARDAGIPKGVGPHTLRHTYAVHLLKGGADLRAVQELLGHESIATTQVYTQLDLDEVQRKYRAAHPRA
ncbi:MAG TPA: tyrosine recombinase [Fimbriimonadaceae bacterium]|nr:tyrosine recombinase [Fimbriimonadaceae bacterium]